MERMSSLVPGRARLCSSQNAPLKLPRSIDNLFSFYLSYIIMGKHRVVLCEMKRFILNLQLYDLSNGVLASLSRKQSK